jgi:hypothetical protein
MTPASRPPHPVKALGAASYRIRPLLAPVSVAALMMGAVFMGSGLPSANVRGDLALPLGSTASDAQSGSAWLPVFGAAFAGERPVEPATPSAPVTIAPSVVTPAQLAVVVQAVASGAPTTLAAVDRLASAAPGSAAAFAAVSEVSAALAFDVQAGNITVPALTPANLAQALQILAGVEAQLTAAGYDARGIAALRAAIEARSAGGLSAAPSVP